MRFSFAGLLRRSAAGGLGFLALTGAEAGEKYQRLKEIPVAGEGGWDYLTVDAAAHRLYVAHATKIVVIDTATDAVAGEIADTPGVHGIAIAPELKRGFTSHGREDKVGVVDLATLKIGSRIETGANPDAILYEPVHREVYAFNGRGKSVTIIAAETGAVTGTIPLGGKPEFAEEDEQAGRVFNNLQDTNEVVVIDAGTHAVVARWPIGPGESATGMAIDVTHHRLFLGCENAMMMVLDSTDGRVVASVPAGRGIDAAAFDPGTQLAFVSNGADGTVTVVHEDSPEKFTVVQTLPTEWSARTMTVDPTTHKIYLVAAKFGAAESGKRPPTIPRSTRVLVYGLGR